MSLFTGTSNLITNWNTIHFNGLEYSEGFGNDFKLEFKTPETARGVLFPLKVTEIDIIDEARANQSGLVHAGLKKQPDLMYVRFKLMHEGANKNLDFFDKEDLKAAAATPVLKHLNWEHGEPTIGTIYYSEFVEPKASAASGSKDSKSHIIVEAAIWKFRYPEIAKEIVKRNAKKQLMFSMEAYFTEAECSECGAVFSATDHPDGTYCDHLNNRYSTNTSAGAKQVYRKLRGFILGGAGVVENPADPGAETLALARNEEATKLNVQKIELTQAELDAKIKEAVDAALADAANKANASEIAEKLAAAEKTLTEKSEALASATKTIESLTAERDAAKAELKKIEDQNAFDAKASERKKMLDEAGYVSPEKQEEADTAIATIVAMTDDVFNLFVATVKAGSKKAGETSPAQATASTKVPAKGGITPSSGGKSAAQECGDLLAAVAGL